MHFDYTDIGKYDVGKENFYVHVISSPLRHTCMPVIDASTIRVRSDTDFNNSLLCP